MDVEYIKKYLALRDRKSKLKKDLEEIEKRIKETEKYIIEEFAVEGINSVNIDNKMVSLYNRTFYRVKPDKKSELIDLIYNQEKDILTISGNTAKNFLDDDELIEKYLTGTMITKLSVRKKN